MNKISKQIRKNMWAIALSALIVIDTGVAIAVRKTLDKHM